MLIENLIKNICDVDIWLDASIFILFLFMFDFDIQCQKTPAYDQRASHSQQVIKFTTQ